MPANPQHREDSAIDRALPGLFWHIPCLCQDFYSRIISGFELIVTSRQEKNWFRIHVLRCRNFGSGVNDFRSNGRMNIRKVIDELRVLGVWLYHLKVQRSYIDLVKYETTLLMHPAVEGLNPPYRYGVMHNSNISPGVPLDKQNTWPSSHLFAGPIIRITILFPSLPHRFRPQLRVSSQ